VELIRRQQGGGNAEATGIRDLSGQGRTGDPTRAGLEDGVVNAEHFTESGVEDWTRSGYGIASDTYDGLS
jgi:hypothetical protein